MAYILTEKDYVLKKITRAKKDFAYDMFLFIDIHIMYELNRRLKQPSFFLHI